MNAAVSILPSSASAFTQESILDHDVNDMLDVEEIFASVFSSFDGEDDVSNMFMTDFGSAPSQEPKVMMTPSPYHGGNFAHVVSPTSSCAQLVNVEQQQAEDFNPTPWSAMMTSVPDSCSVVSAESHHMDAQEYTAQQEKKRVVSPVQKAKTSRPTKKRRVSTTGAVSPSPSFTSSKQRSDSPDSIEQTRQRNREHAKKSRMRKKVLTTCLEQSLEDLKAENAKLRSRIEAAFGSEETESMVQERQSVPAVDQFIANLKQPENRIVDDSTLKFLRGLRQDALSAKKATANIPSPTGPFQVIG